MCKKVRTAFALLSTFWLAANALAQDRIPWAAGLDQARQTAAQQGRLVMIHFYADDCPPCHLLERNVFNVPEFIRAVAVNYVPVKVNAKQSAELARYYGVTRWPTDVLIRPDGTPVFTTVSPQDINQYISLLDQVAAHDRLNMQPPVAGVAMPPAGSPYGNEPGAPTNSPAFAEQQNPYATNSQYTASNPSNANSSYQPAYQPASNYQQPPMNYQQPATSAPASGAPTSSVGQSSYQPGGAYQPGGSAYQDSSANQSGAYQDNAYVGSPAAGAAGTPAPSPTTGVNAQPVSSQLSSAGGASAGTTAMASSPAPSGNGSAPAAANYPNPSLDGQCPVTLVTAGAWRKGDPRWGAMHRNRLYLFAGPEQQRQFLADPDRFSPVMSGFDPVRFLHTGELVEGRREHGVAFNRIYLFASEQALEEFWRNPDHYAAEVDRIMREADARAAARQPVRR